MPSFLFTDVQAAVRALFGDTALHLLDWHTEDTGWHVVSDVTESVHRLRGMAATGGHLRPWSLVAKISRPSEDGNDPEGWQREWRAYTSGVLRPAGEVRLARLLLVTRPSPDRLQLWLEDVPDTTPEVWAPERHVHLASHLGTFNAAHPVGRAPPPWLWQDWLPSMDPRRHPRATALALDAEVWTAPLVRVAFRTSCAAELQHVNEAFDRWDRQLRALPKTLVHLDAGRFNVRATVMEGAEHTVLLDWQSLGAGPVGTDLAMTHFLNVCRFYADPYHAAALGEQCFEAYWAAVEAAGVRVQRSEVRFAFTALSAMRASIVVQLLLGRLVSPEPDLRIWAQWGRKRGWAEQDAVHAWGHGMRALLALGEEAAALEPPGGSRAS